MPTEEQLAFALLRRTDHGRVATSMRALPCLAVARHVVVGEQILLRMHRGFGHHEACAGSVVAYGADNLSAGAASDGRWTVQFLGMCEATEPTPAERALFGPDPHVPSRHVPSPHIPGPRAPGLPHVDGEDVTPVYLRVTPRTAQVHILTGSAVTGGTPTGEPLRAAPP